MVDCLKNDTLAHIQKFDIENDGFSREELTRITALSDGENDGKYNAQNQALAIAVGSAWEQVGDAPNARIPFAYFEVIQTTCIPPKAGDIQMGTTLTQPWKMVFYNRDSSTPTDDVNQIVLTDPNHLRLEASMQFPGVTDSDTDYLAGIKAQIKITNKGKPLSPVQVFNTHPLKSYGSWELKVDNAFVPIGELEEGFDIEIEFIDGTGATLASKKYSYGPVQPFSSRLPATWDPSKYIIDPNLKAWPLK